MTEDDKGRQKEETMTETVMTIEELASYLKVNIRTVYRMLKSNQIPAFKVRGQWRFKKEEIDSCLKEGKKADNTSYVSVISSMPVSDEGSHTIEIPVVGQAACGIPILAEENIESTIPVSKKVAVPPYKYFFLRAKGDSMNTAGINDGDMVLVRQQNTARPKDIIVALIDDEATIKEYNPTGDMVLLKPKSTNPVHKPIVLTRDFSIQGVVITTLPSFDI